MDNWLNWAATLLTIANSAWLIVSAWKKLKPEIKKMDSEVDLDVLEGAAKSQQMLIDRINDLQTQLTAEREARKSELQQEREQRKAELEAERQARKEEKRYMERRLSDSESETKAYRRWAAQLVKQVVEAGKVPAPFIPFTDESQPVIPVSKEEEGRK